MQQFLDVVFSDCCDFVRLFRIRNCNIFIFQLQNNIAKIKPIQQRQRSSDSSSPSSGDEEKEKAPKKDIYVEFGGELFEMLLRRVLEQYDIIEASFPGRCLCSDY